MPYDLFISYSRKDNVNNRVTELKEKIEVEYLEFAKEELKCFFDKDEIKGMEDWKQRLLQGLKDSHLLLLILSPNYLDSHYCEWEIVEYLKYEYARATQGDGVAQIYFMEIPGLDGPEFAEKAKTWIEKVSRRQRFDFRPWYNDGENSLKETDVKTRLEELKKSLHDRILRMRRVANALGNLPAPNMRFVGREREMKLLHESVGLGKFGVLTAVHGMGGLGKTAIAFQYAYAYADFYPGGRWQIGCANETNLASVIKKLDLDLKVIFTEDEKKDDIRGAKRILNELEALAFKGAEANSSEKKSSKPAVLILLDNVDHAELIQPPNSFLISGKEWLKVLVTTRMGPKELGEDETKLSLLTIDELPVEDALSLIESYQPNGRFKDKKEKEKVGEIIKLLGCFTLAIEVAAIYLREKKRQNSFADFLELLNLKGVAIGMEIAGNEINGSINHTKLMSITLGPTIELLSPQEKLTISYASLLPPDVISVSWLRVLVSKDYPELGIDAQTGFNDPWLDLINHLLSLRLLQYTDLQEGEFNSGITRMHRLVQRVVIYLIDQNYKILKSSLMTHTWYRTIEMSEFWYLLDYKWEIPVIISFIEQVTERGELGAYQLVSSLCQWLPNCKLQDSLRILQKASKLEESSEKIEESEKMNRLTTLGLVHRQMGNFSEAENVLRTVVKLHQHSKVKDNVAYAISLNNLAKILLHCGRAEEAIPIARMAIDESYKANISESTTVMFINNLGEALLFSNQLHEAEILIKQSFTIKKKLYGESHPQIAVSLLSMARICQKTGRYIESEEYITIAIPMIIKYYGIDHFRYADALQIKAEILLSTSRESEANSLLMEVLEIRHKVLASDNLEIKYTQELISKLNSKIIKK